MNCSIRTFFITEVHKKILFGILETFCKKYWETLNWHSHYSTRVHLEIWTTNIRTYKFVYLFPFGSIYHNIGGGRSFHCFAPQPLRSVKSKISINLRVFHFEQITSQLQLYDGVNFQICVFQIFMGQISVDQIFTCSHKHLSFWTVIKINVTKSQFSIYNINDIEHHNLKKYLKMI